MSEKGLDDLIGPAANSPKRSGKLRDDMREVLLVFTDKEYLRLLDAIAVIGEFVEAPTISATIAHAVLNYAAQLEADDS